MLAAFLFMVAVEIVVVPVFIVLYDVGYAAAEMVPVALLTTLGIATVGTLFSAMAVNTRAREVMLPILFFPVALPIIVAAVESTSLALGPALAGEALRVDRAAGGIRRGVPGRVPPGLRRRRGRLTGSGNGVDLTSESSAGVSLRMTEAEQPCTRYSEVWFVSPLQIAEGGRDGRQAVLFHGPRMGPETPGGRGGDGASPTTRARSDSHKPSASAT